MAKYFLFPAIALFVLCICYQKEIVFFVKEDLPFRIGRCIGTIQNHAREFPVDFILISLFLILILYSLLKPFIIWLIANNPLF